MSGQRITVDWQGSYSATIYPDAIADDLDSDASDDEIHEASVASAIDEAEEQSPRGSYVRYVDEDLIAAVRAAIKERAP